jgi:hypothetical protein
MARQRNSVPESSVRGSDRGVSGQELSSTSSRVEPLDMRAMWSITVMSGVVASAPIVRPTSAGEMVELDVRTVQFAPAGYERRTRAGVTVVGSLEVIGMVDAGDEVLVLGSTRRRFFRSGTATVARLEVEAHRVVPSSSRKQWMHVVREVETWIASVGASPPPVRRKAA